MRFGVDEETETAFTDGERIVFGVEFLENLNDHDLDMVMMHEILHVALYHCFRGNDYDTETFNIACDIVVNSNILYENNMDLSSITLSKYGESMHLTPEGEEGYKYIPEQIYKMLMVNAPKKRKGTREGKCDEMWDDHSKWGQGSTDEAMLRDTWIKNIREAIETVSIRNSAQQRGTLPLCAQRLLTEMKEAQTDWKRVLNEFIQEEITDYSFFPPDRRFDESPFFLPDYNEKDDSVEDVLFMIDTSGSMSDEMIAAAYSEINGAFGQFNGRLKGWLGFFDAEVVEPVPFTTEDEFKIIRPYGGGGTRFDIIFKYVNERMEKPPVSIIILTDGYAPFPKQEEARGIPVLWLLNNTEVTPPWGKVTRIKI
jgi:predicted metal-dependent peptidase